MILKCLRISVINEDLIKPFKLKQMLFGHAAYTFDLRNLKKADC